MLRRGRLTHPPKPPIDLGLGLFGWCLIECRRRAFLFDLFGKDELFVSSRYLNRIARGTKVVTNSILKWENVKIMGGRKNDVQLSLTLPSPAGRGRIIV
jgi:hypothetical protein